MKKRLAVLGSTGSIGRQTLDVVRAFPDRLEVIALAAGSNVTHLESQVREFKPRFVSLGTPGHVPLRESPFLGKAWHAVPLQEIAAHPDVDLVVIATSGRAGLLPTLAAIRAGKTIALANKEVLVMAGEIIMAEARRFNAEIRPVDSEHSAIWQCLQGEGRNPIARIILTASGGAFRDRPIEALWQVTPEEALRHPTWTMGKKVTIDSANLMNKGFEVIEAHWLFGVPFDKIEVVLHPASIVHSMVELADGSIKAQLGVPDMRLPIQYAISYPERWGNPVLPRLDLARAQTLVFAPIDMTRYPCLKLAFEAGRSGGTYPAALSAADEIAVAFFLEGRIGFLDIPRLLEHVLERHRSIPHPSIEDVLAADAWARETAERWCSR